MDEVIKRKKLRNSSLSESVLRAVWNEIIQDEAEILSLLRPLEKCFLDARRSQGHL